jgi:cytochrome c oxidase subunit 2
VKQDLVPGRMTEVRITPTTPGEYKIQCAEVCGPAHYSMIGTIIVLTQAEFDAWAAEQMAAAAR